MHFYFHHNSNQHTQTVSDGATNQASQADRDGAKGGRKDPDGLTDLKDRKTLGRIRTHGNEMNKSNPISKVIFRGKAF